MLRTRERRSPRPAVAFRDGTLRLAGPKGAALPELNPGDVLVVDLVDLDRATAEAIVGAGVGTVVNVARLGRGRYAGLGPAVLAEADLAWIDEVGREGADLLVDGAAVRIREGEVHLVSPAAAGLDPAGPVAAGRELDLVAFAGATSSRPVPDDTAVPPTRRAPDRARPRRRPPAGVPDEPRVDDATPDPAPPDPAPPDPVTPDPAPPEQVTPGPATPATTDPDISATGDSVRLQTTIAHRPVVVVVMETATYQELRALRRFIRKASPVLVMVGVATTDDLVGLGCVPDLVVRDVADHADTSSERNLPPETDVVVVCAPGEEVEPPCQRIETTESALAVALRLVEQGGASVVVGAGFAPEETWRAGLPFLGVDSVGDLSAPRRGTPVLALVLALVVGGALGAGGIVLAREPQTTTVSAPTNDSSALTTARDRAQAGERSAQSLISAVAPAVYGTGLTGHGVVVIGLPGASTSEVASLADQVRLAGGAASRSVTLASPMIDPDTQNQVDTVGTDLLTQLDDSRLDPTAASYVRMGQLLALATTTVGTVSAVADPTALTIREALQTAGLATFPSDMRLAPTILLVLPAEGLSSGADTALLSELLDGLATTATAVMVVGDTGTAQAGGALADLRAGTLPDRVSTVDGVDQPTGRLTMVLALESALAGTFGAYGAAGVDGPVPASS